jgi:hypothetical protein
MSIWRTNDNGFADVSRVTNDTMAMRNLRLQSGASENRDVVSTGFKRAIHPHQGIVKHGDAEFVVDT